MRYSIETLHLFGYLLLIGFTYYWIYIIFKCILRSIEITLLITIFLINGNILWILNVHSNAWDWDCRFVWISRRSQFVSISDWLFIAYKLKYGNLKLFESILGIVTTLTNEKHWYFTLPSIFINWYVMHSLFF